MPTEVRCEVVFGENDSNIVISDVKYLVELEGKTFLPAREALAISG